MRFLIDGYNLMYAGGLIGKRLGPTGFHRVRTRFLNDLAFALGPVDAHQTTVVFDASSSPEDVPKTSTHQGLSVVFAVDQESADDRIEQLIAGHSTPKSLTVVSSDRRLRQAATRRRARSITSEEFWVELDRRKERKPDNKGVPRSGELIRDLELSDRESAYWQNEFRDLEGQAETKEALGDDSSMLSDDEIAEIEREVDGESG